MEKLTIEIETSAGWVQYHSIMRDGEDRAKTILAELKKKFPYCNFRIVKWTGSIV